MKSLGDSELKILPKMEFFIYRRRPFCFSLLEKIPQECQGGTRLIFIQDSLGMMNHHKNFMKATKHAFPQIRWTTSFGIQRCCGAQMILQISLVH